MTKDVNFKGAATPSIIDTEYEHCNFSIPNCLTVDDKKIGMRLFPGDDTPRTFIKCNLVNCETPPGSTIIKCNTAIRENTVEVGSEDLVIDAETIKVKDYADMIYGRYIDGQYVYQPTPIRTPCKPPEVV